MKLIKSIMTMAAATLLAACQTDVDTPQLYAPENVVAPVINDCSNLIVNADNAESENVIFSWTPADFGLPIQISYQVYVAANGNEALVGASNSTNLSISKGDFNGVVINGLGVEANTEATITAFVTAQPANSTEYETVRSEQTEPFSIQTYQAALKWLYLVGEFNNWGIDTAPIFWETGGGTNVYECMVDFTPTNDAPTMAGVSFFKLTPAQNWDSSYGMNDLTASWTLEESTDGNISMPIADAVINSISVNLTAKTIDHTAIGNTLGLVGDFSGWADGADVPFVYDALSGTWTAGPVNLDGGTGVKVRIDGKWDTSWGSSGKSSSTVPGGYELDTADNVTVPATGNYIVKLHANRTPMVLEFVQQ